MSQIVHISDTHFGTEDPAVVDALLSLVQRWQPSLLVLSGDITQRARSAQFAAAKSFLDQTALPWLAIPGNHDLPLFNLLARATSPYGNYRHSLGHSLEPEWENNDWLVVGVNSTRPHRHKHGELSDQQIERVAARLRAAAPSQRRVVVLHHPLRAVDPSDRANLARGHAKACISWHDAGVDLVLGGHIHLPYIVPLLPSDTSRGWLAQVGTAVSTRTRGNIPNSFNRISASTAGERGFTIERYDYHAESGEFRRFATKLSWAGDHPT